MPAVRAVFNYEIFNEEGKLIHEGETTLVFVNVHIIVSGRGSVAAIARGTARSDGAA